MKKIYKLFAFLVVMQSKPLVFQDSLEGFLHRVVEKEYQDGFREYYGDFLASIKDVSHEKKQKDLVLVRKNGLAHLEIEHQDWYQVLEDHAELDVQHQSRATRKFLTRYALYQDYKKISDSQHTHVWAHIKMYTSKIGKKLSAWRQKISDKSAVLLG